MATTHPAPPRPSRLRSLAIGTVHRKDASGKDQTITTFVASTDVEDRYDDIVSQESWRLDDYRANPVVLMDHYYSVSSVVGRVVDMRVEERDEGGQKRKALVTEILWDTGREVGAEVAGQVERQFVNAVSVGFRSHRMTPRARLAKDDPRYGVEGYLLEENELYEISVVAIPANQEALARRSAHRQAHELEAAAEAGAEALIVRLLSDDQLWQQVEARRLSQRAAPTPASKAPPTPASKAPAPAEEGLYWLR